MLVFHFTEATFINSRGFRAVSRQDVSYSRQFVLHSHVFLTFGCDLQQVHTRLEGSMGDVLFLLGIRKYAMPFEITCLVMFSFYLEVPSTHAFT